MAIIRLKYVYRDKDRQGRTRWLLRVPGRKAVTLKGHYGSPEFMAHYQSAIEGAEQKPKKGLGVPRECSLAALVLAYQVSATFKGKASETQRSERNIMSRLVEAHGDKPWAGKHGISQAHIQAMIDARADTPSAARNVLNAMRSLGAHAMALRWRNDNPAIGVKRPKIKGKGYRTWSDEDAAAFEAKHPPGTRARIAYEIASCTALRRSDIVRLGRQHVRPLKEPVLIGAFKITHELHLPCADKNDEPIDLPILPSLQAAIDALPSDNLTFILGATGKPLAKESFGNWFHECCIEAGLLPKVVDASGRPKGLAAHGLRKRMGAMLADLNCSDRQIMAVLGDSDPRMASTYTTGANRKRMAWSALTTRAEAEQPGTPDLHTPGTALHTAPKTVGNEGK